jgi:hypothetical protein
MPNFAKNRQDCQREIGESGKEILVLTKLPDVPGSAIDKFAMQATRRGRTPLNPPKRLEWQLLEVLQSVPKSNQ